MKKKVNLIKKKVNIWLHSYYDNNKLPAEGRPGDLLLNFYLGPVTIISDLIDISTWLLSVKESFFLIVTEHN